MKYQRFRRREDADFRTCAEKLLRAYIAAILSVALLGAFGVVVSATVRSASANPVTVLVIYVGVVLVAMSTFATARHGIDSNNEEVSPADLTGMNPTQQAVYKLMLGPIAWMLFWPIWEFQYNRDLLRAEPPGEEEDEHESEYECEPPSIRDIRDSYQGSTSFDDVQVAFLRQRGEEAEAQKLRHLYRLRDRVDAHRAALDQLKQQLQTAQKRYRKSRRELHLHEQVIYNDEGSEDLHRDELTRLYEVPNVLEITVEDDKIVIYFYVRVTFKGEHYDNGDWKLICDPDDWSVEQVRKPGKGNSYRLLYYDDTWGFCFGNRLEEIANYMRRNHILAAFTLMLDSMSHVNAGRNDYFDPLQFFDRETPEICPRRMQ